MRLKLDYGTTGLDVELPDDHVTVIEPVFRAPAPDPHRTLLSAMRAPIDSRPLPAIVKRGQRLAVSVCDITRAQPRRETLDAIFAELPDVRREDVTILIATGTHRANTPAELDQMLGPDIARQCRVVNHDSRDASAVQYVGRTTTGVEVRLNRQWLAADVRITT